MNVCAFLVIFLLWLQFLRSPLKMLIIVPPASTPLPQSPALCPPSPVFLLLVWSPSLMAEVFLKSGMSLACQFIFKHEVLKADWKLCVHGQNFVDHWGSP